jgi:hypothetical protein
MVERMTSESRRSADRSADLARREADRPRPEGRPPATPTAIEIPIAAVIEFYGDPDDLSDHWMVCDGSEVTDVRSPLYGGNVPDKQDRFPVGAGSSFSANATGGHASIEIDDHAAAALQHGHVAAESYTVDPGTTKTLELVDGGPATVQPTWAVPHAGRSGVTGSDPTEGTNASGRLTIRTLPPYLVVPYYIMRIW